MDVGIIGLGRMGSGVAARLLDAGHRVVVANRSPEKVDAFVTEGAVGAYSLEELVTSLSAPRIVWLYLPSGLITQEYLKNLSKLLSPGDIILDGGNSKFSNTLEASILLQEKGITLLDVGTSGGIAGRQDGYCLMIGGSTETYTYLTPLWNSVAQANGHELVGPVGSGHYVKMVHNAIEYGMMQAYGEGMELLMSSRFSNEIDLPKITKVWQNGSIIRSFLGQLLDEAISEAPTLETLGARIDDNGEGRWAIEEAIDLGISTPVITASLYARYDSRKSGRFTHKVVAVLRSKFGGHTIETITNQS